MPDSDLFEGIVLRLSMGVPDNNLVEGIVLGVRTLSVV
jgi:hypothetical protein